jgi:3-oxoacyl-[acyl-carrier-protein] synthase-3
MTLSENVKNTYAVITGSGSYIPKNIVKNSDFLKHEFYEGPGKRIEKDNEEIIDKFYQITDIEERRYVEEHMTNSEIAYRAAKNAIESSGTDPETIDYIIVGHNFGDIKHNSRYIDTVPSLATRVKYKLGIENPFCVGYDVLFGCPGWLEGVIQANLFIKAGAAKKVLVIGTETLSRVYDPYDRDGMIYSDGAGATIIEAVESEEPVGILSHLSRTDAKEFGYMLWMDKTYKPDVEDEALYLKMQGRKLYNYALSTVPPTIKATIDQAGITIDDIKKIFIHQANAKMDEAMVSRLFKLYHHKTFDPDLVPMTINKFGNNSVATLPVLYDLVSKGQMEGQEIKSGDYVVFASVGAGVNVNSVVYKVP